MHIDVSITFKILTESPESQYPKVAVKVRNWLLELPLISNSPFLGKSSGRTEDRQPRRKILPGKTERLTEISASLEGNAETFIFRSPS
jgi:hypothetical protein